MIATCTTCKTQFPAHEPCRCGHKHVFHARQFINRPGTKLEIVENDKPTGRIYTVADRCETIGDVTVYDHQKDMLKVQLAPKCEVVVVV